MSPASRQRRASGRLSRRSFLSKSGIAATALIVPRPGRTWHGPIWTPDKLRLGVIGVAGRGGANLGAVASQHIVALCDVDEHRLAGAAKKFPKAKRFVDFHELIELDKLDAVVVSTPDHTHFPATKAALTRGLDVYCEKPLTHTVAQAREIAKLAQEHKAVTQMGTQIHALDNYRRVVELVQSGAIGKVREAWAFCNKSWSGKGRPKEAVEPPSYLHWDLWLGTAPPRPYHPGTYHPANWRRFWDFGGGTLADMGCHYLDLVHWALKLRVPQKTTAKGPPVDPEGTPTWLEVHYEHPHHRVHWYDGGKQPPILAKLGLEKWKNGVLFVTDDSWLISNYAHHEFGPKERFKDFKRPAPWIPKSIGHHKEWIEACKTRGPTTCNFDYSGALTQAVLLGNDAYRKV